MEEFRTMGMNTSCIKHPAEFMSLVNGLRPTPVESDPIHAMMVKKKEQQENPTVVNFDINDIQELEDFCMKYGIVGVGSGMNPKATLSMLKKKMGIIDTKRESVTSKKQLLNG